MVASLPSLVVEIAFVSNPLDTAPTWVTVSADRVRNAQITRGRGTESSTFTAGSFRCQLDNRTRDYDPLHATGPYFGNLLPRKQIRVTAVWSAVTYPLFRGFISGWPQEYAEGDVDAWVPIEAYDALTWLDGVAQPDVFAATTQTAIGSCTNWWRAIIGTAWIDTVAGVNAFLNNPTVDTGTHRSSSTATVGGSILPGSTSSSSAGGRWSHTAVAAGGGNHTLSIWFQTAMQAPNNSNVSSFANAYIVGDPGSEFPAIRILDGAGYPGSVEVSTGPTIALGRIVGVNDGRLHHLVVTDSATAASAYIDGALIATSTFFGTALNVSRFDGSVNYTTYDGVNNTYSVGPDLTLQDVAYFSKALSATEVALLYGVGSGVLSETTSARVTRLLDSISWPAAWRSISTGVGTCGEYLPFRNSTLSELQTVEATEQGRVFVDASGNVTFHSRYYYLTATRGKTSQANLSDDGATIYYRMFGTDYDEREVYNDIQVNGSGSVYGSTSDATSQTSYGIHSQTIATVLPTSDDCTSMATGLILHRKNAQTRTRPIEIQPAGQTSQWATLLGLEIGDRLTVEITPMRSVGAQTVLPVLLEQISWDLAVDDWVLTVGAVPVPGAATASTTFMIADDATYGKADTGRAGF